MKKKNKDNFLLDFSIKALFVLFLACIGVSSYKITTWLISNQKTAEISNDIASAVQIEEPDETEDNLDPNTSNSSKYNINFAKLKATNSDTVAWLKINGTDIEYPVVKSTDNDFYLTHSFDKSSNGAGWIFADYRNTFHAGEDKNIIIYGHNRRNGSMFSTLKNVLNASWYKNKENHKITFITETEACEYAVFSVYQTEAENYDTTTDFNSVNDFAAYIEAATNKSIYAFDTEATIADTLLTVSTCANDNRYRVVLHAKKIQ